MASVTKKLRNRPVNEGDEIEVLNREIIPVILQVVDELRRIGGDVTVVDSENYEALVTDRFILQQAGYSVNLPDAESCKNKILTIINISASGTVTITTNDDALISGAASKSLSGAYDAVTLLCDGEDWWIIAEV